MPRGIDSKKGVQLVYRRFSAFHRFNHYLVMVSFFGLALTGMPLKFQDSFWSQLFINAVGGVEMAGLIHRVMAVANITYFLLESGYMVYYVLARKGPIFGEDSIVPSWKDWRDMRGMFRWFFGKGPKPRFNRFTYLETGVIFIFVHFFSAHGRPESFPADQVIFSGYLSVEHCAEDRPAEYQNRLQSGTLEEVVQSAPPEGRRRLFSVVAGAATIFAFTAATYTLLLILWPLLF